MEEQNQGQYIEPSQNPVDEPVQEPQKSSALSSKWLKVGIGTVFVLVLLGGAYLLGQNTQKQEKSVVTSPSPIPIDETANWETYTNSQEEFSFKYPPDWDLSEKSGVTNGVSPYLSKTIKGDIYPALISILKFETANFSTSEIGMFAPFDYKVLNRNNNTYVLIAYSNQIGTGASQETEKVAVDTLAKIYSTFKFTDSADETANWKTYTNSALGFGIKYPDRIIGLNEDWEYAETSLDGQDKMVSFGTPSSRNGGYIWGVNVYHNKKIEDLIKEQGEQWNDRKEKRETVSINEEQALLVTVTTNQAQGWISKNIYIEKNGKSYQISNGAIDRPEFNDFYRSFKFLD